MLGHTFVKHPRWDVPTMALLLPFFQAPENDSLTMGETVCHIGQIITRITIGHVRFFPRLSAEDIATMGC